MAGLALESYVDKPEPAKPVDREKTCPLLLRVFCSTGRHNNLMDYNRNGVPNNELQIYTWMDATLRELADLIRGVNTDADKNGTTFDFILVTHEMRPNGPGFRMRNIGTTIYGTKGSDDTKTLSQCRFTIGDYMDVCIHPPSRMGGGGGGPIMRRGRPQY